MIATFFRIPFLRMLLSEFIYSLNLYEIHQTDMKLSSIKQGLSQMKKSVRKIICMKDQ